MGLRRSIALVYRREVTSERSAESKSKLSLEELAAFVSTLQAEMLQRDTKIDSMQETIVNLSHENELLKRRLFGNKTERLRTSEHQLALGTLLDDEKQLQKQLDAAVAATKAAGEASAPPAPPAAKAKPKGRRDLSTSDLPKVLLEILDEDLEKSAKRVGWDVSHQLLFRRGGFAVLVKRVAKYEVPGKDGPTVLGVQQPRTLFPRGLLHSSVVAHILVQKFGLGVPHYRLEQHIEDQGVPLDRGMMCRYTDEAGGALGASIVHAMWQDSIANAAVISADATGGLIQPTKRQDARPARKTPIHHCQPGPQRRRHQALLGSGSPDAARQGRLMVSARRSRRLARASAREKLNRSRAARAVSGAETDAFMLPRFRRRAGRTRSISMRVP